MSLEFRIKKYFKKFLLLILFGITVLPVFVLASDNSERSWEFEEFDVAIQINKDASFNVVEKQTINFRGNFHFVTRSILKRRLDKITDIKVVEENGDSLKNVSYSVSENNSYYIIRVDFDLTDVTKTFLFKYKVWGGIGYFSDYDELYWNAISAEREVPIKRSIVKVTLPEEVSKDQLKQAVYTDAKNHSEKILDSKTFLWKAEDLPANSNFTIVCGFPKDIIYEPFTRSVTFSLLVKLASFLGVVLVFMIMFILWFTKGRDKGRRKTIIAEYNPPDNLRPGELGLLIKEKFQNKFITATLIDLAIRGYLKIIEKEKKGLFGKGKDYSFECLSKSLADLKGYEKLLLEGIFGSKTEVDLKDLENKFYREVSRIEEALYQSVDQHHYFFANPKNVRAAYFSFAGLLAAGGLAIIFWAHFLSKGFLGVALITMAMIIFLFGRKMAARTKVGSLAYEHSLGFREYLHTAERYRLQKLTPETFEKFLPYAMVFGVEKEWAEKFKNIYQNRTPNWYVSSDGTFSAIVLASSLNSMNDSFMSAAVSKPGGSASSGSGFSGGFAGGGGGGGGSSAG